MGSPIWSRPASRSRLSRRRGGGVPASQPGRCHRRGSADRRRRPPLRRPRQPARAAKSHGIPACSPTGRSWRCRSWRSAWASTGEPAAPSASYPWTATSSTGSRPGAAASDEPPEQDPIAGLLERHRGWAPEIARAIEATPPAAVLRHALLDRKPVKRWCGERIALLGDAAHPMLPFIGQGGCQALEDATTLGESLSAAADISSGLRDYEARRRRRASSAP